MAAALKSETAAELYALLLYPAKVGIAIVARMPIIAMMISNSIRVKPLSCLFFLSDFNVLTLLVPHSPHSVRRQNAEKDWVAVYFRCSNSCAIEDKRLNLLLKDGFSLVNYPSEGVTNCANSVNNRAQLMVIDPFFPCDYV